MTNYVGDRIIAIDSFGEKAEIMNDQFKYGVVFYNRNCKSSFLTSVMEGSETHFLNQWKPTKTT